METLLLLVVGACGAVAGRLLRLPVGSMTGALIAVAALKLTTGTDDATHPAWSFAARVLVGGSVGALAGGALASLRTVPHAAALVAGAMLGAGAVLGLGIAWLTGTDPATALFGTVAGGAPEMTAAATSIGADGPLVATMHLVRLVAVMAVLPVLTRLARRYERRG